MWRLNPYQGFEIGDQVWIIDRGEIKRAKIVDLMTYGDGSDPDDERASLEVEGSYGTYNTSVSNIKRTRAEMEKKKRRKDKLSKIWLGEIQKEEAMQLMQLHHSYDMSFFKNISLWDEGHEYFQGVRDLADQTGLPLEPDEGWAFETAGILVNVTIPQLASKQEAAREAKRIQGILNRNLDDGWRILGVDVHFERQTPRAMHEREMERRYGHLVDDDDYESNPFYYY
jgi:hypothetical protein